MIHPGDVRKRAINTLIFSKQENVVDFITNITNKLQSISHFEKHVKLLKYLLKSVESVNKDIKD